MYISIYIYKIQYMYKQNLTLSKNFILYKGAQKGI